MKSLKEGKLVSCPSLSAALLPRFLKNLQMIYNVRKDGAGDKLNAEKRRKVRNIWAGAEVMTETVPRIRTDI